MSRLASQFITPLLVTAVAFSSAAFAEDAAPAADAKKTEAPADAKKADAPAADTKAAAPQTLTVVEPAKAEAPKVAEGGVLSLSSTPTGKVFLDGKDTGLSTPIVDMPVAVGPHTIKVVDEATGKSATTEFTMDKGGVQNLNLTLADAAAATTAATTDAPAAEAPAAEAPVDDWTWMTVAGWSGLGVGTIALLAGAVFLTSPTDGDAGPLGFGLFFTGVGLLVGGGVLLYLDSELNDDAPAAAPAAAEAPAAEPAPAPAPEAPKADTQAPTEQKTEPAPAPAPTEAAPAPTPAPAPAPSK